MIYDQFQTDKQAFELVCINGVYQIRVKSLHIWFDALIGKFFWKTLYFSDSLADAKIAFYKLQNNQKNTFYNEQ
jgi:hypothetical protein